MGAYSVGVLWRGAPSLSGVSSPSYGKRSFSHADGSGELPQALLAIRIGVPVLVARPCKKKLKLS